MESKIKWKQKDYLMLGRAVSNFNKKVRKLQNEENKLYLPDTIEYKNIKENITTRRELNRIINSLNRFKKQDAADIYTTASGEVMTKWERRELGIQSRIAQRRLTQELKSLNEPIGDGGFSRAQMGSIRIKEIEAQLKNLKSFETKRGQEFQRMKDRISKIGVSDYTFKKALVYRQNYLKMIEGYKNFENYSKFRNKLESITNPIQFYNFVSQNELLADITFMYDMNSMRYEFYK